MSDLKKLSLEELMNVEVTLVSGRPKKLHETASAIQVIPNEFIRRSAAARLPEALRLAPNLQVAQSSSHGWAITARGFNGAPLSSNSMANKLLVMLDGRTIYTPLFAGVFWDIQNVVLEDVDKIEVISGPGGTLWGANAVNGVINIVRKSATDTQGFYVSGSAGTLLNHQIDVRYGGKLGEKMHYRVYGQRMDYNHTYNNDDEDATDSWRMNQAGFRVDYEPSAKNTVTLQGDFYKGSENGPDSSYLDGQNLMIDWKHTISERSDFDLQVYFDRTWRDQPLTTFNQQLTTYDIDFSHFFSFGDRHRIVWGVGYRHMRDRINNAAPLLEFDPADLNFSFFNVFARDEVGIIPNKVKLIFGAKLSDNYYSGLGFQPSGRISWMPDSDHTVWAAVSHALRSPGRFDADMVVPFDGKNNFDWEKVTAFEAGHRMLVSKHVNFSLAAFYNKYKDLRSIDLVNTTITIENNQKASSWGAELSFDSQISKWWRLRGGYTYLNISIDKTAPTVFDGSDTFESLDADHHFMIQSMMDLPANFFVDVVGRYTSELEASPSLATPEYFTIDARIAWKYQQLEFSVSGRNLLDQKLEEFGRSQIPRNIYGTVTWRM
ncbi:TonB-dependent receptor, plug [Fulvivirga imtechensis AK7]|uniref:TonB-dependent receptor, plug n=1 Tax=Fulvivirga imtechensis AK7 TaxID=1237149 RepID=L8JSD2_9BACT|nr:TonB-dependent receptor plug domain-containing protein [Fulvivirga imtechensis]ELR71123.1 TonB-dependent receptor, plug [Fulvivirga imtechensis AK7]